MFLEEMVDSSTGAGNVQDTEAFAEPKGKCSKNKKKEKIDGGMPKECRGQLRELLMAKVGIISVTE